MSEIPKIDFEQKLVARAEMPLLGKKVLFTAPRHYAGNLARLLVERGARPVWMPTIAIYPVDDYTEFDRALRHLDEYTWVGITSIMGSQAYVNRIKALGLDAAAAKKAKIAAFGPDAIPLSQLGIEADLIPPVNYPSTMIQEMEKLGPEGGRVLVPVPEVHGVAEPFVIPEFISELERIGMHPERFAVYATHATNEGNDWAKAMLAAGEIDVTLITSSAEIFSLMNLIENKVELVNRGTVAYMGGYTAKTGKQYGFNVDLIPEVFSMPGVVEALEAYFRGK
jgi:uroporphyrinogen-III synthase